MKLDIIPGMPELSHIKGRKPHMTISASIEGEWGGKKSVLLLSKPCPRQI